jgi:hypothetical protein
METFFALHEIASQRGDGLRPELVRLLERARAVAEIGPTVSASIKRKVDDRSTSASVTARVSSLAQNSEFRVNKKGR